MQHRGRERDPRRAARLLYSATLLAVGGCAAEDERAAPRVLDATEMEAVRGGVAADITFPSNNSTQNFDNLRFTANITGSGTGSSTVGVFAGATKVGQALVAVPGTWDGRTQWPLPGGHTAQFKFLSGSTWVDADGDSTRTNVGLHSSVNVYGIRARSLNAGANSTSVTTLTLRSRVDDLTPTSNPTRTTNNVDGVYGQCGGNDKTQWRLLENSHITTTEACADLGALTDSCGLPFSCAANNWSQCEPLMDCLDEFYFPEAAETEDVYVFHVLDTPCSALGVAIQFTAGGASRNLVLMKAAAASTPTSYTDTLAHELGHEFAFGHCEDGNPATQCTASDCTTNTQTDNLMCEGGPGRALTTGQCTGLAAGLRWTDIND